VEARLLIERALREDVGTGDITSGALVPEDARARGSWVTREAVVVCGLEIVREVVGLVDPELGFEPLLSDGDPAPAGAALARVEGSARSILAAERTSLNFLPRLTGIATSTRAYVARVEGHRARILDTRKTVPGFRLLDKYAVRTGGGVNHRQGLFDAVLIKDNHLAFCPDPADAVRRARARVGPGVLIEVEVESLEALAIALRAGPDRILIDNFDPARVREAVGIVGGRVSVEASGGITLENVGAYAEAGVDYISVGALTHSVRAADIHMSLEPL
jgi:nicotinate-nucleotide pyrophosphorylase (carboxylating)